MTSRPPPRKVYVDLLLGKDLGYPLYCPEPDENAVRRGWNGVSIGDVGTINGDGGFDFHFNVVKRPIPVPDTTFDGLHIPGGWVGADEIVPVANGLPLHAELNFHPDDVPKFDYIDLTERDVRYSCNNCHRGVVIGEHTTHTISADGQILLQVP
jgi:hypothetical protein